MEEPNMLTIHKKYKKTLAFSRKQIVERQEQEEKMFLAWCRELNIHPDGEKGNMLFGYLFNGETFGVKIKNE
jgi:hypothetical protein